MLGAEEFDKYTEKHNVEMETDPDALPCACVQKTSQHGCWYLVRIGLSIFVRYTQPYYTKNVPKKHSGLGGQTF